MTPREKSCVLERPGKGFLKSECLTDTVTMRMRQLLQPRERTFQNSRCMGPQ